MKKCCVCKLDKKYDLFHKNNRTPDGLTNACGDCINTRNRQRSENRIIELDYNIVLTCNICEKSDISENFTKNKNSKFGFSNVCKKCNVRRSRKWAEENIEQKRNTFNIRNNQRKKEDPLYKLSHNIRSLIYHSFKRASNGNLNKSEKTEVILGCSIKSFITHLESLFTEGMTLENHGQCEECWHIDHKIPLASAQTEGEIIKLCHYTNLQPLWASDNLSKGGKIV